MYDRGSFFGVLGREEVGLVHGGGCLWHVRNVGVFIDGLDGSSLGRLKSGPCAPPHAVGAE